MNTEIKERGMLMHARSVNGIKARRKIQTRRLVKPQPVGAAEASRRLGMPLYEDDFCWRAKGDAGYTVSNRKNGPEGWLEKCPYGKVGDRLYVRETHGFVIGMGGWATGDVTINYRADGKQVKLKKEHIRAFGELKSHHEKWRPSIFMPRWACRFVLEITEIRLERVQDISEADAMAEGIPHNHEWRGDKQGVFEFFGENDTEHKTAVEAFAELWDDTNGKGAWDANGWCWVICFKVVADD